MENKTKLISLIKESPNVKEFLKEKVKDGNFEFLCSRLSKNELLDSLQTRLGVNQMTNEVVLGLEKTVNNIKASEDQVIQLNIIDSPNGDFYLLIYADIGYTNIFGMI